MSVNLRALLEEVIEREASDLHITAGECPKLRIDGDNERHVVIEVISGGAIPNDLLPSLFMPFKRGHHTSGARRPRGVGLGLYITQQIVHAHRGELTVRSGRDVTTFRVELPRS